MSLTPITGDYGANMISTKIAALAAASCLLVVSSPVFAAEGTTLAGPAQGSKANGEASTKPSTETGSTSTTSGSNAGNQPTTTSEQHEKLGN